MQQELSRREYDRVVVTTCGECPTGCGVSLFVKDEQVVDLLGARAHPVSGGAVCARGSAAIQHLTNPRRRRHAAVRGREGTLQPATWDEALGFAAERLRVVVDKHGPQAVVVAVGRPLDAGFAVGAWRFASLVGTPNLVGSVPSASLADLFGPNAATALTVASTDWPRARAVLLVGDDPAAEYPVAFRWVQQARRLGARVIALGPRFTATLAQADLPLLVRPGAEALTLLTMARIILDEGEQDQAALARWLPNLGEWIDGLRQLSLEEIGAAAWLPVKAIRQAALTWAGHRPGVVIGDAFAGTDVVQAAAILPVLTGSLDMPGGGWNWLDTPGLPFAAADLAGSSPEVKMIDWQELAERWDAGPAPTSVRAAVGSGDFLPTLPHELVKTLELVVQFGSYPDATSLQAHAIFPAANWAETDGVLLGHDRRAQRHCAVLAPPGESRSGLEFWTGLADRLGWGEHFPWRAAEGQAASGAFAEWLVERVKDQQATASAAVSSSLSRPAVFRRSPFLFDAVPLSGLALFGRKVEDSARAWCPWLAGGEAPEVRLHPVVAEALEIKSGEEVVLASAGASLTGVAMVSREVAAGSVWCDRYTGAAGRPVTLFRKGADPDLAQARLHHLLSAREEQA